MNPSFNDPAILAWLETNSEPKFDTLPYVIVKMGYPGRITVYLKLRSMP